MSALTELVGKKIFTKLTSGRIYTGIVKEVEFIGYDENNAPIYLISLTDKLGFHITFSSKEFKFIEEQK